MIVFGFLCWVLSGIIPAMVVWEHNYGEILPMGILFLSAFAGPVAGIVHFANWR